MSKHDLPDVAALRQLVDYDPDTGAFTYRHVPSMHPSRNSRVAGRPAFHRKHRQGYLVAVVFGRQMYAHRAAWALAHGSWPTGEIDHINHDRADNRLANLRVVGKAQNMRNMPKLRNNSSGRTGVYLTPNGTWLAAIRVDRKLHNLGRFSAFEDAVAARAAAEKRFGFHKNHGIGPDGT